MNQSTVRLEQLSSDSLDKLTNTVLVIGPEKQCERLKKSWTFCGKSETNWWRTQTIEENCGILKLCEILVQSLRKAVAVIRYCQDADKTELKLLNCEKPHKTQNPVKKRHQNEGII